MKKYNKYNNETMTVADEPVPVCVKYNGQEFWASGFATTISRAFSIASQFCAATNRQFNCPSIDLHKPYATGYYDSYWVVRVDDPK